MLTHHKKQLLTACLVMAWGAGVALSQTTGTLDTGETDRIKAQIQRLENEIEHLSELITNLNEQESQNGVSYAINIFKSLIYDRPRSPSQLATEYEEIQALKKQSLKNLQETITQSHTTFSREASEDSLESNEELRKFLSSPQVKNVLRKNHNRLESLLFTTKKSVSKKSSWNQSRAIDSTQQSYEIRKVTRWTENDFEKHLKTSPKKMFSYSNVSPTNKLPEIVDARHLFPEVRLQGHTFACAAFAIAGAMEVLSTVPDDLSERHIYGLLMRAEQPYNQQLLDQGVEMVGESLFILSHETIPEEQDCPWTGQVTPPELNRIEGDTYQINEFATLIIHPDYTSVAEVQGARLLEQLIHAGKFPLVTIASNTLVEREDWVEFSRTYGGHVFVVVGYGEDINPFSESGHPEPYFLIRNSLASHKIHQKIPAETLYRLLAEIDLIKSAGPTD